MSARSSGIFYPMYMYVLCAELGVPVSMDDVALIENARKLRAAEESITPTSSDKQRAETVEHIERCRWFHREEKIEE